MCTLHEMVFFFFKLSCRQHLVGREQGQARDQVDTRCQFDARIQEYLVASYPSCFRGWSLRSPPTPPHHLDIHLVLLFHVANPSIYANRFKCLTVYNIVIIKTHMIYGRYRHPIPIPFIHWPIHQSSNIPPTTLSHQPRDKWNSKRALA